MPPRKQREQQIRKATAVQALAPDVIAKRTRRHLDELERSNYAEPALLAEDGDDNVNKYTKGRGRQTISDKRTLTIPGTSPAATKKKSTMNVRTALLYRKNLATLIEESNISSLPPNIPTYLTATAPPSAYPPRMMCSVCGFWGSYRCQRCAMPYCDRHCEGVHAETRCERRINT